MRNNKETYEQFVLVYSFHRLRLLTTDSNIAVRFFVSNPFVPLFSDNPEECLGIRVVHFALQRVRVNDEFAMVHHESVWKHFPIRLARFSSLSVVQNPWISECPFPRSSSKYLAHAGSIFRCVASNSNVLRASSALIRQCYSAVAQSRSLKGEISYLN